MEYEIELYRKKWIRKLKGLDDFELSYIAGFSCMELAIRGYCARTDVDNLEKIVGDEFERRAEIKKRKKEKMKKPKEVVYGE